MKKRLVQIAFLLLFVISVNAQREDSDLIIKTIEKTYAVQYPDSSIDRFLIVYTAHLTAYMKGCGKSSTLTHPVDTRCCNYRVSSYIKREGFFLTGSGKRVPLNEVTKIYGPNTGASKRNDIPEAILGKHSPCNDYIGDFNSKKESIKKQILEIFDGFFTNDFENTSNSEISVTIGEGVKLLKKE